MVRIICDSLSWLINRLVHKNKELLTLILFQTFMSVEQKRRKSDSEFWSGIGDFKLQMNNLDHLCELDPGYQQSFSNQNLIKQAGVNIRWGINTADQQNMCKILNTCFIQCILYICIENGWGWGGDRSHAWYWFMYILVHVILIYQLEVDWYWGTDI